MLLPKVENSLTEEVVKLQNYLKLPNSIDSHSPINILFGKLHYPLSRYFGMTINSKLEPKRQSHPLDLT